VLSLKALLAGTRSLSDEKERRIQVRLDDKFTKEIVIPPDQAEVLQLVDLSPYLKAGTQTVTLTERGDTAAGFQVVFRYHVPERGPKKQELLTVDLKYDRDSLTEGEAVGVTARVGNAMKQAAAMVMAELPVPAGFAPRTEELSRLVTEGKIDRFEVEPRRIVVYLRELPAGGLQELTYRLEARLPVKITAPGARVYEYYAPERQGFSPPTALTVKARP
jgi:hypothetical protein